MLSESELARLYNALHLCPLAEQEVNRIRESEPSRRVGGGRKNVSGSYPSRKMGKTIQFESHKVELPFIYQLEHDERVLEFYDQPPSIKINYQSQSGRKIGCYITPDFFVIRTEGMEWVECKTEEQLQKLAQKDVKRYNKVDNHWHSPPATEYARQFGLAFRIYSDAEINWTQQRNLEILADYYREDNTSVPSSTHRLITSLVAAKPGITLAELLHRVDGVSSDAVYRLIANESIFIDLNLFSLAEPQSCSVFQDSTVAKAHLTIVDSHATSKTPTLPGIELISGQTIAYDGEPFTIAFVGQNHILLQTAK